MNFTKNKRNKQILSIVKEFYSMAKKDIYGYLMDINIIIDNL